MRIQTACDYLTWMGARGKRPQFLIPVKEVTVQVRGAATSTGKRTFKVLVREGKVRKQKKTLRMPEIGELRNWLASVYDTSGFTKGLMCETVLETAIRKSEASGFRFNTLPVALDQWVLNSNAAYSDQIVRVPILFGAKGKWYGDDHGDKIGPERSIWIRRSFADRLHHYRTSFRNHALQRWVDVVHGVAAKRERISHTVHLFLEEDTGRPLSGRDLYEAWTNADVPFKGWCPQLGRDWWACSMLWNELLKHEQIARSGIATAAALLESSALSIIRLRIQPQLGHADDSTTMIYLQWVLDRIGSDLPILWEQSVPDPGA